MAARLLRLSQIISIFLLINFENCGEVVRTKSQERENETMASAQMGDVTAKISLLN